MYLLQHILVDGTVVGGGEPTVSLQSFRTGSWEDHCSAPVGTGLRTSGTSTAVPYSDLVKVRVGRGNLSGVPTQQKESLRSFI